MKKLLIAFVLGITITICASSTTISKPRTIKTIAYFGNNPVPFIVKYSRLGYVVKTSTSAYCPSDYPSYVKVLITMEY